METGRLRKERDLFLRLLEIAHEGDLAPVLEEALRLAVAATNAKQGYLEVYSDADRAGAPRWSISRDCSAEELAEIREVTSRGIVAEALATGTTIHTPSALLDSRFSEHSSVRRQRIEAVLCTPLGAPEPIGVLYLQGQAGAGPFSEADVELVELFAKHVAPQVRRLLVEERARREEDPTRQWRQRLSVEGIVGRSRALAEALKQVSLVAPLEVPVLLTGPSGTGKTCAARAIHDNSPRRGGPFVELNCATIPESLIENELFGAAAGAHSTAHHEIHGKVAAAERGTLFLDEVGELAAGAQAKLLQLLQSKEYYPLGSTRAVRADIRVIAATNVDVHDLLARKQLREDLYYRLNVLPIRMPSLAERPDDVLPLAQHFIAEASRRHGLPSLALSPSGRAALESAEWPGNVRQLANTVEAGLIRAIGEACCALEARHLLPSESAAPREAAPSFQEATRRFQKELLERTLAATQWNIVETAKRLDLTRSHVYNLIRLHELTRSKDS